MTWRALSCSCHLVMKVERKYARNVAVQHIREGKIRKGKI
jgi:hypothetical protein